MAGPPLVWNQGEDGSRQPKSRIAYGTVSFHFYHAFHIVFAIYLLTAPREIHHAFETHPGRFFTLAFMTSISIVCSGLRLLVHDILFGILLDIVSTVQDVTMAIYLAFYSTTLVGGFLFTEGLSCQNMSLLCPAVILYSAVSQHLFRLLLRFMAFTKWDPFAKWDPLDISTLRRFLGTLDPKVEVEQAFYLYATTIVCISGMLIGTIHILVGSEEWADKVQTYFVTEFFPISRILVSAWCCVNLTIRPFLPSPTSRISVSSISPTSLYPASISLCFPRLRQLCSSFDLVASFLMFAFAAANSVPLFWMEMEPILLFRGRTSWIQATFWARQLTTVAATFFTGVIFLVIRRERTLVRSMTTIEQLRSTIVDSINGPKGLEFLVLKSPKWTDDEIVSLLKLPGLTGSGRDKVAGFLYREREMAEILEKAMKNKGVVDPDWFNKFDPQGVIELRNLFCENSNTLPPYSPEDRDLELGLGKA